jgi:hypothetical protein
MNTKYIVAGAILLLVAIGIFFSMQKQSTPGDTPVTSGDDAQKTQTDVIQGKRSLRELMALGGTNVQCTFASVDGTTRTEGNSYVSNGMVRTDSTITSDGNESMTSSSIIDGDVMYAWGSAMPNGMKMSLSALEDMKNAAPTEGAMNGAGEGAVELDAAYDYTCTPWAVDPAVFVPPIDVTFTDYSEMMQGMQQKLQNVQGGTDAGMFEAEVMGEVTGAPSKAMLCGACDRAPDPETQAQCRAVAGCE